jgi:hypothetical protein
VNAAVLQHLLGLAELPEQLPQLCLEARPLSLQLLVSSWIANGCVRDLVKLLPQREDAHEHLLFLLAYEVLLPF